MRALSFSARSWKPQPPSVPPLPMRGSVAKSVEAAAVFHRDGGSTDRGAVSWVGAMEGTWVHGDFVCMA